MKTNEALLLAEIAEWSEENSLHVEFSDARVLAQRLDNAGFVAIHQPQDPQAYGGITGLPIEPEKTAGGGIRHQKRPQECYDPEPLEHQEAKREAEYRGQSQQPNPTLRPSSAPENPRGTTQFDSQKLSDLAKHVVTQADSIVQRAKALQQLLDSNGVGRQSDSK